MDPSASTQPQEANNMAAPDPTANAATNPATNEAQTLRLDPQQEEMATAANEDDGSSDWETEPSETHMSIIGDDIYDSEMASEDDLDSWDEDDFDDDFDDFDDDMQDHPFIQILHGHGAFDIERLKPGFRAVRRTTQEDVMSDFSGDEKYEPKESYSDESGQGDKDMTDFNHLERASGDVDGNMLAHKIRRLMINLTKGRRDREKKLNIKEEENMNDPQSESPFPATEPHTFSPSGAYLHRLMVRGSDYPKELQRSPAVSFHHQCANSLVVTPSIMGVSDDVFTISTNAIMRCGVIDNPEERPKRRKSKGKKHIHRPYAKELNVIKATKFLKNAVYQFNPIPPNEIYVPHNSRPLCITHRYGYLLYGTMQGNLVVHCTRCGEVPVEIFDDTPHSELRRAMVNSAQIVRWQRYQRSHDFMDDQDERGDHDWDTDATGGGEEDDCDQDGYPATTVGQFDHYAVMTLNSGGLVVVALPDHAKEGGQKGKHSTELPVHELKFADHTWIRGGFQEEALNDARVSPNGRWIAVVGDSQKVWTIEITHVPETEEQRMAREGEVSTPIYVDLDNMDADSEYVTEDSMSDEEIDSSEANEPQIRRGEKRPWDLDDAEESSSSKSAKPVQAPKLLRQFGQPIMMPIPDQVLYGTAPKKGPRRRFTYGDYSSQYVAWNATSTKFAHSSDVCSRVVVWSMPSREIVCCVDIGGTGYAIDFHPKLENLFAVANWYGFVHVVDVTGSCVGDEDLIPSDDRYDGQTQHGPGLVQCDGPHYEEKHDILLLSFRGEKDTSLRILDGIRGLGWSTDGRHLYVSTLRRVLQYELADRRIRIPSLFQMCAQKVRVWKERISNQRYTKESNGKPNPILPEEWQYVPYAIKRKIWGDTYMMR